MGATPPVDTGPRQVWIEPSEAEPGHLVNLVFRQETMRGGYWWLSAWTGKVWDQPAFLLQVLPREPAVTKLGGQGVVMHDYGLRGPGPDQLILPEDIESGHWRLCQAPRGEICVQLLVASQG